MLGFSDREPLEGTGPVPNDADEFVAMFAPFEERLIKLYRILESER
jgi:hypothetical protein